MKRYVLFISLSFFWTMLLGQTPGISPQAPFGCAPFTLYFQLENVSNPNDWTWFFEGGIPATSTDTMPEVTYNDVGTYTVLAVNSAGDTLSTVAIVIASTNADFSFETAGTSVSFTIPDSLGIDVIAWDFGDGTTSTEMEPTHIYAGLGAYQVSMQAMTLCGDTATITKEVAITGGIANAYPVSGCAPLTVTFTNLNPGTSGWYWTFTGADTQFSTDVSPEVTFYNSGVATLIDTVAGFQQEVVVNVEQEFVLPFTASVGPDWKVFFNHNNPADSYLWNFGDGDTSSMKFPVHQYDTTGVYDVTLTITNPCGQFSYTKPVVVDSSNITQVFPIDTTIEEFVKRMVTGNKQGITNVTGQYLPTGIGTFEGLAPDALGMDKGIILCTGDILLANGPNGIGSSASVAGTGLTSTQLENYVQQPLYDAAFIEFDFVPATNVINFSYVFASEEYEEYVGTAFNDVFAFLISGPGIQGVENIALIPGTNDVVSINTVNQNDNSTYYQSNTDGQFFIEYDGLTVPLVAEAVVLPGESYHLFIGIADASDHLFDSAVFLKANSFESKPLVFDFDFGEDNYEQVLYEDSLSLKITVTLPHPAQQDFTYHFEYGGDAVPGLDYLAPAYFVFPQGETTASFKITALADDLIEDDETIRLIVKETQDTLTITVKDQTIVGLDEVENAKVALIPNPAHDVFALPQGIKATSVAVFDLTGKRVRFFTSDFDKMNIADLPKGFYTVRVQTPERALTGKLKVE